MSSNLLFERYACYRAWLVDREDNVGIGCREADHQIKRSACSIGHRGHTMEREAGAQLEDVSSAAPELIRLQGWLCKLTVIGCLFALSLF